MYNYTISREDNAFPFQDSIKRPEVMDPEKSSGSRAKVMLEPIERGS
jgi:hypothetical protein